MEEPPQCRCGQPAEPRTVRKEGPNQGRQFWGCSRFPDASACKFFQWAKPGAGGGGSQASQQQGSQQQGSQQRGSQQQWQSPGGARQPQQLQSPYAQQQQQSLPFSQAQQQWSQPHPSQQQSPYSLPPQQWSQQQRWSQQPSQPSQQLEQWSQPSPQATPASQRRPRYASPASLAAAGKPFIPLQPPPEQGAASQGWDIDLTGSPPQRPSQRQLQPAGGSQGQWGGSQGGYGGSQGLHGSQTQYGSSQGQSGSQGAYGGVQGGHGGSQQPPPVFSPQQLPQLQPGWPGGSQSPRSWYGPPPGSQQQAAHTGALSPEQQVQGWAAPPAAPDGPPRRNRDGMIMGGQGPGPPIRVNLQVLDAERFGAQYKYNEPLKEYIKSLAGPAASRWDPQPRMWTFSLAHHDEVLRALQGAPVPILISPLPQEGVQALLEEQQGGFMLEEAEVQAGLRRLPRDLWQRLYSFQREGVRRGVAMGGRCLIADEMGLGKTVQALMIAACFAPEDWPLLIITPATMKLVWQEAVRTWLPPELAPSPRNLAVISDGASMDAKLGGMEAGSPHRVLIVSYEMAKKLEGRAAQFHTVIADESHLLKTLDTQRTRAVTAMAKAARRVILCTGTPALARPLELFPQINMLRPGLFGSLQEFGMRYCDGRPAEFPGPGVVGGYDFRGASNLAELSQRLERHLMIRRLKAQVLDDLPEKIRKRIPVETDPAHGAALQETRRAMEQNKRDEAGGLIDSQAAALNAQRLASELYRRTGPAKVRAAAEHVRALVDAGQKVLIFAHHAEVLDELQQRALAGVRCVRIDGQVNNEKRKPLVDRFQKDERCRAALLSITAAGVGITLTAASVVVFAELYWNPGSLVQAEDRAHRMGQRHPLEVHYLVAPGTADDAIWEKCKQKLAVVGDSLGQEHAEEAFEVPSSQHHLTPAKRPAAVLVGSPATAARGSQQQQQQTQQQARSTPEAPLQGQQSRQRPQQSQQQQQPELEVITISDSDGEEPARAAPSAQRAQQARPAGGSSWHEQLTAAAEARAAAAASVGGGGHLASAVGAGTQQELPASAAAAQNGVPPVPGRGSDRGGRAVGRAAGGRASSAETEKWDEEGGDWGAVEVVSPSQAQHAQQAQRSLQPQSAGQADEDRGEQAWEAAAEAEAVGEREQQARRKRLRQGDFQQAALSPTMPRNPRDVAPKFL